MNIREQNRDEKLLGFLNLLIADKDITEEELNTAYDDCVEIVKPLLLAMIPKPKLKEKAVKRLIIGSSVEYDSFVFRGSLVVVQPDLLAKAICNLTEKWGVGNRG